MHYFAMFIFKLCNFENSSSFFSLIFCSSYISIFFGISTSFLKVVKVLNNFVASCSVVAVRHVLSEAKNLNITTDQLLKILNNSSGHTWFSENLENIDWAKENYETDNTIAILEKDVKSYLDGLADSNSSSNKAMVNFQNALLNGLKNIPKFPHN